jgi:hypothetical protein
MSYVNKNILEISGRKLRAPVSADPCKSVNLELYGEDVHGVSAGVTIRAFLVQMYSSLVRY